MSTISMDPQVYRAAKLGKTTLLQHVVDEDSSRLLRVTPNKNTALHVSVTFGHREFVKKMYFALLQHNSSLEGNTEYSKSLSLLTQVNSEGDTALHVAAREGHASIAKFLIEKIKPWPSDHDIESGSSSLLVPEKIRMRNESKNTALHEAVQRNDLEMVKLLTEVDPDLGHPNYDVDVDGRGESPLYLAAKDGHLDILNHIFLICPSPAHGGPYGRTALHVAVIEGRLDVVKILLEKKGEVLVNKADKDGRTALHYAVSNRYKKVLEQLLSSRYNVLKIVQQLLRHDTSSAYKLDKDGLSPLHIAALESSIKVFRELIQWCPDSGELLDKKRRNVLHFAVTSKDFKKISFALRQVELEGLVNKTDDDGNTPFHLAATLGSFMLMRHFLSIRRVDVKATWEDIRIRNPKVPWFSLIWGKKMQPRVSIFGWRMVHDKLPTDDAIQKRGIVLVSKCSLCGMEAETSSHIFLQCSYSEEIWLFFCGCFNVQWQPAGTMGDFLTWWRRKQKTVCCKEAWIMGLLIVADHIWRERNLRRHDGKERPARYLKQMILEDIQFAKPSTKGEVKTMSDLICCRKLGIPIQRSPPKAILEVFWCRPEANWIKLNFDGSSRGNPGRAGAGGIFRDHRGGVLGSYKIFMGVSGVFEAEIEGLMVGLMRAREMGIPCLWVETDSSAVAISIQQNKIPWFALQRWIFLQPYLESITWKITHNFREANSIADYLARDAAKTGISAINVDFPANIKDFIRRDADGRPNYRFD